jgi:hypothetical protein
MEEVGIRVWPGSALTATQHGPPWARRECSSLMVAAVRDGHSRKFF